MYESVNIIFQILSNLTNISNIDKFQNNSNVAKKHNQINFLNFLNFLNNTYFNKLNYNTKYNSMETLINHFKNYSDGIKVSKGFTYKAVEAPKGEFGVSLISDGSNLPYRCKIRTPAYHHMQLMSRLVQGHFFADLVTVLGSQDIVFGDVDR